MLTRHGFGAVAVAVGNRIAHVLMHLPPLGVDPHVGAGERQQGAVVQRRQSLDDGVVPGHLRNRLQKTVMGTVGEIGAVAPHPVPPGSQHLVECGEFLGVMQQRRTRGRPRFEQ